MKKSLFLGFVVGLILSIAIITYASYSGGGGTSKQDLSSIKNLKSTNHKLTEAQRNELIDRFENHERRLQKLAGCLTPTRVLDAPGAIFTSVGLVNGAGTTVTGKINNVTYKATFRCSGGNIQHIKTDTECPSGMKFSRDINVLSGGYATCGEDCQVSGTTCTNGANGGLNGGICSETDRTAHHGNRVQLKDPTIGTGFTEYSCNNGSLIPLYLN